MNAQIAIQNLLQKELAAAQRKNASFSLRAFAQKVGLNPGALSGILNGKRRISPELARRICNRLHLDPQERAELLGLFPKKRAYRKALDPDAEATAGGEVLNYLQISASQFRVIAEWEHYALLSLMKTIDFESTPEWIAARLGISEHQATETIRRLIEVGMVVRDEKGTLSRTARNFRTTDDVLSVSLQKAHLQSMQLAAESLQNHSLETRDFSSITMPANPKKLSMAKELIRKFQDELASLVGSDGPTEVYRLSMQLFPMTRLQKNGGKI